MIYGAIIVFAGLFSAFCAFRDFDWFMNNRKARPFVNMFGRNGARVFYMALGAVITVAGICCMVFGK